MKNTFFAHNENINYDKFNYKQNMSLWTIDMDKIKIINVKLIKF